MNVIRSFLRTLGETPHVYLVLLIAAVVSALAAPLAARRTGLGWLPAGLLLFSFGAVLAMLVVGAIWALTPAVAKLAMAAGMRPLGVATLVAAVAAAVLLADRCVGRQPGAQNAGDGMQRLVERMHFQHGHRSPSAQ